MENLPPLTRKQAMFCVAAAGIFGIATGAAAANTEPHVERPYANAEITDATPALQESILGATGGVALLATMVGGVIIFTRRGEEEHGPVEPLATE